KNWVESRRTSVYSVYGRVHRAQGSAAERVDGSVRRYRWAAARKHGCISLQRVRRILRRTDFHRPGMVCIFSESIQPHPRRNARWRTYRDRVVALVVVARFCITRLVWMEISKLHYLANCPSVGAEGLFAIP